MRSALASKTDVNNGTLTDAIVGAASVNMTADPSLVACPVGSCPPLTDPKLAYAAIQQYTASQKDQNWELGAVFGMLDQTGAGTGEANDDTPGAKMGAYIGLMQTANGGPGWALNTNIVRNMVPGGPNSITGYPGAGNEGAPGAMNNYSSTIGYELDVSNFDKDSNGLPPSYPFVVGEYITTTSTFSSYAGIHFGIGQGQTVAAWHNGILFTSPNSAGGRVIADNTIADYSNSDIGWHTSGQHATASFFDESSGGKYGAWFTGTKSIEDIDISTGTLVGIGINGTRGGAGIHLNVGVSSGASNSGISDTGSHGNGQSYDDQSTSAVGIKAEGTYSYAAFSAQQANTKIALAAGENQEVCFSDSDRCVTYDGNTLVYSAGTTRLFAIDNSGNLSIKGSLTQNGNP
ncbi:hypothetical protein D3W54_14765 [Komagataeibacter medellinensis]|uniref:Uncharacterized protein n=2 Tax=Komagataeibacter medellinensis TaxID=1177712 RepID=A0ABQ6VRA0_9PROT|nr:hypothetical protein D3W54_14765 [Komagataeibacter medellinensis]